MAATVRDINPVRGSHLLSATAARGILRSRRSFAGLVAGGAALALIAGCGAPGGSGSTSAAPKTVPEKPSKPVSLNILDVAGDLALTQGMIDDFVKNNPNVVSKVTYQKATAPELVGKIKAQQNANRVDITMVLTGVDGLASGRSQNVWMDLLTKYKSRLPGMDTYQPAAANMQKLAGNDGVAVTYYPSGPLLEFLPKTVPNPPKNTTELLAYAKAHPGKFQYAQPSNSGPGRTFLMGLPYLLGDSDPKDPVNGWAKTWAYLAELNKYVDSYPSGTSNTMKNLADGSVSLIASTTGWDINPRVLGTVPKEAETTSLDGFHWVSDAHYAVVPKGVSADTVSAELLLLNSMLKPDQQAKAYDDGYFYPGPAVQGVTISMAPAKSQQVIAQYGRAKYEKLIADNPIETPLESAKLVAAFDRWDREIGGAKIQPKK
jgi:putative spermidine/putrescine transport system substrate-binding protein